MLLLTCGHATQRQHVTSKRNGNYPVTICYDCCATRDLGSMLLHGNSRRLPLYLSKDEVTNWPGTLRFQVIAESKGRHNIAGTRTDIWFRDFVGYVWHGTQYGDNTQVVHCKRTNSYNLN